jgi:hypothetical protein
MADRRRPLPDGMMPRLLSRDEAAAYCGVSAGLFEQRVGIPAVRCFGTRRLWDRHALDRWLDGVSGLDQAPPAEATTSIAERLNG